MTASISRADVVGGHDGRAEIEIELTYDNGGSSTISLDEEACLASLDQAGIGSIDELVGKPWTVVLPALTANASITPPITTQGELHARPRHP